jgi:serine/threonine-protein kinase
VRFHAQGGLGEVYVADDQELHREVALKCMKRVHAEDAAARHRYLLEAEVTGRLEHPGVVPVYGLGQAADSRPFYAMRFVRGETLHEAIRRFHNADQPGRDPGERSVALRQLLGRFLTVCNTVAYAHSRGILHCDLKPLNVMLGAYGETLVVDWGLARPFSRRAAERAAGEETLVPSSHTALRDTPGAMGTPGFMSPEQANGWWDAVGPASDVYSLGVTLYVLLTGRVPFSGSAVWEVLARVQRGEFLPPREVKPGVPRALEAICLKAMALRPEDRYPSALALANDLERWLADEPVSAYREPVWARVRRWARRRQSAVAAGVAALLVAVVALGVSTILIGREQAETANARARAEANFQDARRAQAETEKARARAEVNFQRARQAVDEMAKVAQEQLVSVPQLEPVRRQVLERALTFYKEFREEKSHDPLVRAETGRAYRRVGDIYQTMGMLSQAEEAYRQAIPILQRLADEFPDAPEHRRELAVSYSSLGWLLYGTSRNPEAEAAIRRAIALQEPLVAGSQRAPAYRRELATSFSRLGLLLTPRAPAEAANAFHRSLELRRQLAAEYPDEADYWSDLGVTLSNLARLLRVRGEFAAARRVLEEAVRHQEAALKTNPQHVRYRRFLVLAHWNTGKTLADLQEYAEAEKHLSQAIRVVEQLTTDFPWLNDAWQDLAWIRRDLGGVLLRAGRAAEAEQAYRAGLAILERLLREAAADPARTQELAARANELAWFLATCPLPAVRDPARAVELAEQAVQLAPKTGNFWNTLGVARYRTGHWKAAITALETSLTLQGDNAHDEFFLAMAHWQLGDRSQARQWFDKAVQRMERDSPYDDELRQFRAEASALLGISPAAKEQ